MTTKEIAQKLKSGEINLKENETFLWNQYGHDTKTYPKKFYEDIIEHLLSSQPVEEEGRYKVGDVLGNKCHRRTVLAHAYTLSYPDHQDRDVEYTQEDLDRLGYTLQKSEPQQEEVKGTEYPDVYGEGAMRIIKNCIPKPEEVKCNGTCKNPDCYEDQEEISDLQDIATVPKDKRIEYLWDAVQEIIKHLNKYEKRNKI